MNEYIQFKYHNMVVKWIDTTNYQLVKKNIIDKENKKENKILNKKKLRKTPDHDMLAQRHLPKFFL